MIDHGHSLGIESNFGQSLIVTGESLKKLAGLKYDLEDNIKDKFLDPLHNVKHEGLKNITVFFFFFILFKKKTESKIITIWKATPKENLR